MKYYGLSDEDKSQTIELKPLSFNDLLKSITLSNNDFFGYLEEHYQIHLGVGEKFSLSSFLGEFEYPDFVSIIHKSLDYFESRAYKSIKLEESIKMQRKIEKSYVRYWEEHGNK